MLADPSNNDFSSHVQWKLQYEWNWAPWITAIFIAVLIAWVIYCYRLEVSPAKQFTRGLLGLLRLTTIGLILAMLSQLVYSGVRTGMPRIAILLDRSESMLVEDVSESTGTNANISRSDAVAKLLQSEDVKLYNKLSAEYKIDIVSFDSEIQSMPFANGTDLDLNAFTAEPESTSRFGDALIQLINKPASAPLQGIIAYTDGQVTQGRTLSEASALAKRKGIPLYLVGLGDDKPAPSLQLESLLAEDQVYPDDLVNFQATLNTSHLSGQPVTINLSRNGKVVQSKQLVLPEDESQQTIPVQLIDRPPNEGRFKYTMSARLDGTESTQEEITSELTHQLTVKKQQLRVLLAAGYPNYEFRYLKHLLERDSSTQLTSFLQESDVEHAYSDMTAISRFPLSLDELNQFEVIILVDLDPSLLPRTLWPRLSEFVSQQGGGLALVAGPRYLPQAYLDKPQFLAMLPTKPNRGLINGWNDEQGYQLQTTDLGRQTPSLLLNDSLDKSERVWQTLPPLYWLANVGTAKPSAQVLAFHPTYMASATKNSPAIVTQYYGAGRVLLHATDSTYRWRQKVGDVYFARYWGQTMRMLAKDKINSTNRNIRLTTTEDTYNVGEAVKIQLSGLIGNEDEAPRLRLSSPGKANQEITLDAVTSSPGRWQARLPGLSAGKYSASLLSQEANSTLENIEFEIEAPPGELTSIRMNREELEKAAKATRGKFFTYEEANQLLETLPKSRPVSLENVPPYEIWNRWPFLLGICVSLCMEWIIRKRQSML